MDDETIVELYWSRSEDAIKQTQIKYGNYCYAIAYRILRNREDSEESVNDTYLGSWNSMPPHRPQMLSIFLGKITRRVSLGRLRGKNALCRGGGEVPLALEELEECLPDGKNTTDSHLEARELAGIIDDFLSVQSEDARIIFVKRYWLFESVIDIAESTGFSESKVKTELCRTRKRLRTFLEEKRIL